MDYGIYEPFYEKLCIHIPSVCREGELFQFVLPVKSAGWDDIRDGGMYQSMDCIPLTEDAFFHDSDLCFTSVYTSYLRYLSAIVSGEDEKKVASCLQAMETDYVEVYAGEHMLKKAIHESGRRFKNRYCRLEKQKGGCFQRKLLL